MKPITIYECNDGTRFDSPVQAENYDIMAHRLHEVENRLLGSREKEVAEGRATQDHPVENVLAYQKEICNLAAEYIPDFEKIFRECGNGERHITHAERVVSDYNHKMFRHAFSRLSCINTSTGIEYEQPYYAANPDEWIIWYERYIKPKKK